MAAKVTISNVYLKHLKFRDAVSYILDANKVQIKCYLEVSLNAVLQKNQQSGESSWHLGKKQ